MKLFASLSGKIMAERGSTDVLPLFVNVAEPIKSSLTIDFDSMRPATIEMSRKVYFKRANIFFYDRSDTNNPL